MINARMLLILISTLINSIQVVHANPIENPRNLFSAFPACEPYTRFLAGLAPRLENSENCHPVAEFLVENQSLPEEKFWTAQFNAFSEKTMLGVLNRVILADRIKDHSGAYLWSEVASTHLALSFAKSGDQERAVIYSLLLNGVRSKNIEILCADNSLCTDLAPTTNLSALIGQDYLWLDRSSETDTMKCLLRTDAFSVQIRKVFDSRAFKWCLGA